MAPSRPLHLRYERTLSAVININVSIGPSSCSFRSRNEQCTVKILAKGWQRSAPVDFRVPGGELSLREYLISTQFYLKPAIVIGFTSAWG